MKPRISWEKDSGQWLLTYGRSVMEKRVRRFRFWPLAVVAALAPDVQAYVPEVCS